jgi:hypothetical protein
VPMLQAAPGIRAVAIFEEICRRHPQIATGVRRTLERRITGWRAPRRAAKWRERPSLTDIAMSDRNRLMQAATVTDFS